jgi:hypothetical protein
MWRQRRGGNAPRSGGLKVDPRCLLAAVDRGDAASIAGWFKLGHGSGSAAGCSTDSCAAERSACGTPTCRNRLSQRGRGRRCATIRRKSYLERLGRPAPRPLAVFAEQHKKRPAAVLGEQTLAWTQDGGQVLGLAPSAAAAAVLGEQTGVRADSFSDPRPSQSSTESTSSSPGSPTAGLADPAGAPTALAAESEQHPFLHLQTAASGRDLSTAGDMAAVLYWRLPALTPANPGPLPWLPGIPPTLHAHLVWGPIWRDPSWSSTSRPGPRSRLPRRRRGNLGCSGNSPQCPRRRNRSVAGRQRHQSPRPATNRRNPTRNPPGPRETTPRPGCRACHRPTSKCEGQQATSRTHRS